VSLAEWISDGPRREAENVTLPELITLGRIDRMWGGRRPTHYVFTEDWLWKRGLLEKYRSWDRADRRWFIWYEITPSGYAMSANEPNGESGNAKK
jgi:hypothetical protein